mmetsp:Transcript_68059/g.191850  ORF Transcript_68059/g.191850 Transcript_68059/m.191850 type:complete len:221 (+) Transcript_68059:5478-6140(+)
MARRCAAFSASRKASLGAMVGGPSSNIFWKRRCVEQSRPMRAITLPCSSPTSCTSRCRAPTQSCIMKTGEPTTSARTRSQAIRSSFSFWHFRIPLPPPPSEAFSTTGYPMRFAQAIASSTLWRQALLKGSCGMLPSAWISAVTPSPFQGMHGTPEDWARIVEAILSPRACITGAVGPRNVIPSLSRALGSSGFSLACPQPGHTACTCWDCATSQISSTFA